MVEQNCIYQDMDGDDQQSIHLWLTVGEKVVGLLGNNPKKVSYLDVQKLTFFKKPLQVEKKVCIFAATNLTTRAERQRTRVRLFFTVRVEMQ